MITINATGFIAEKPQLVFVGQNLQKCEFDVVSSRRAKIDGTYQTVFERASFIAWGEEAERIASYVEKGNILNCTGGQETSSWTDRGGNKRFKTRYGVLAWNKVPIPRPQQHEGEQPQQQQRQHLPQQRQNPSQQPPQQSNQNQRNESPPPMGRGYDHRPDFGNTGHEGGPPTGYGSPDYIEM